MDHLTKFFNSVKQTKSYLYAALLLLLTSINFSINAQEADDNLQLSTPKLLNTSKMDNRDDALKLLNQDAFHQQIFELATQLPIKEIENAGMFNKVALLSRLEHHTQLLELVKSHINAADYTHWRLHSETKIKLPKTAKNSFAEALKSSFKSELTTLTDEQLVKTNNALGWSVSRAQDYVYNVFKQYKNSSTLTVNQAINLVVNTHIYRVVSKVIPISKAALKEENNIRYIIEPEVIIKTKEGIELSATIVKKRNVSQKLPTALQFTIYADEAAHINTALHAAAHGYIGVVANSRGKRSSSSEISPWEYDGKDATSVIDWISKQSWSDGRVVMYGGSYNGFTQWAATKYMHPALTAIAPYTAASLITGLPYENNIALTGNYEWASFVTNNKTVDNSVYSNWQKSNELVSTLFKSGKALQDIDKIDGKPNPWFQKWLKHPSFDSYYQAMVPVKEEYKKVNIPVLTVTGYFDGGQISAIDYLTRHYKYNRDADHTLLIGPYNHGTAQSTARTFHSNYKLDEVALEKDTEEVVFAWFDHLLFNKVKPKLLKDKVNYQLMGSNTWQHQPSLSAMNNAATPFYLSTSLNNEEHFDLLKQPEKDLAFIRQTIDLTDRTTELNKAPWPIISKQLIEPDGLVFMTEVMQEAQEFSGSITGNLSIAVNKQDVDIGYNLYEINKDGQAFHLNNYRSRASFAHDMSKRQLLTPGKKTIVPIINARMTAILLKKGSRLAIVFNVNKNKDAQVNMGSGKNVNKESIADAGEPLEIKWFNDSQINIPLKSWPQN